jgi:lipoate---protein ligase
MAMRFEVLLTSKCSPEKNMELDIKLLESLAKESKILLHFYAWEGNCATYGYFIDPSRLLNKDKIQHHNLHLARRPTGGGLIFHHCDLAFSVLIPASHSKYSTNTLNNYALVNSAVVDTVRDFIRGKEPVLLEKEKESLEESCCQFCMAKPTVFDVILHDRKVGGGAQRRTKYGLLHQGSIALSLPSDAFLDEILLHSSVSQAMRRHGYFLLGESPSPSQFEEGRRELQFLLMKALQTRLL